MNPPLVSVVIPAYNCASTIGNTITAVLKQSYAPVEIIVVDDGSKDATAGIIQNFKDVKYIYQENAGPAAARNAGARMAKGEAVFFTDSDCYPLENWISTAIGYFRNQDISAVAGSYDIANPEFTLSRCIHKEILYRHYNLMPLFPKAFGSYNVGIRRTVFNESGGFNVQYRFASGEDNDLSYKLLSRGHKIYFEKEAKVKHTHQTNVLKYLKEQYRHGHWRAKLYKDYPRMAKGDDYTFWKDMIEPVLTVGIVVSLPVVVINPFVFISLCGLLMCIELCFSILITRNVFEIIYFSFVMFFRSFARGFGLLTGITRFFLKNK